MIAKVRIAPMERWCWFYLDGAEQEIEKAKALVGTVISIKTESMRPADCNPKARMWDATEESWKLLDSICGCPEFHKEDLRRGICEHVLEMD